MSVFYRWGYTNPVPLRKKTIQEEHEVVRTAAGLFDVSHMGEIEIAGEDAVGALNREVPTRARDPQRVRASSMPSLAKASKSSDSSACPRIAIPFDLVLHLLRVRLIAGGHR